MKTTEEQLADALDANRRANAYIGEVSNQLSAALARAVKAEAEVVAKDQALRAIESREELKAIWRNAAFTLAKRLAHATPRPGAFGRTGCVADGTIEYCDQCPAKEYCPHEHKNFSK